MTRLHSLMRAGPLIPVGSGGGGGGGGDASRIDSMVVCVPSVGGSGLGTSVGVMVLGLWLGSWFGGFCWCNDLGASVGGWGWGWGGGWG